MKVLTIKQPWATLIANEIKQYEFRSWKTNYRGKLLIHAGLGKDREHMNILNTLNLDCNYGQIIASVDLVDCIKIDDEFNKFLINEKSIAYGNEVREGYAWKLENIQILKTPIITKGKLGLWNIDLESEVEK
ncbi:MAG: ASCH domain-containing protein [Mycoplasmatota bacterium]